ncbi:aminoimidazole riboside kinase [Bacillus sp. DNRA2]|uniref:aminoimidazole riboside kinase n=1 Tax=Bacillus sp. DNRA2 TaxID=2723053 RepID=UPI00145F57FE|nr:aminoimidazole riboside kinase [Bacillus sp. DNRA2]NMD68720.1 aminoimidazole riboside kinase [Bacillus sp. DNRA2]
MKNGVISLGEALIDFIPMDASNSLYQKCPGGAPANVAVGLARLNVESLFLGKVGNDVLGRFLIETLGNYGVDTTAVSTTDEVRTGAVFVTLAANGERSFDFYINPSADQFLQEEEIKESYFKNKKILHIGSISLINEPVRSATHKAVALAKQYGMLISYDPNLRLGLWSDAKIAKSMILSMLPEVDVLKVSEEELEFLTGAADIKAGVNVLQSTWKIPFIIVTCGANGSILVTEREYVAVPALKVNAIDTTGAGDAYVSGILYRLNQLSDCGAVDFSYEQLLEVGKFASVAGGLAAATKGAMTGLPTLEQIIECLKEE